MSDDYELLDARGYRCPMPVIRMEARLRRMRPGDHLKVIADDPVAAVDIPHFCREAGHRVQRLAGEETGAEIGLNPPKTPENQAASPSGGEMADGAGKPPVCVFLVTRRENP